MRATELIEHLKRKLTLNTYRDIAKALGMSEMAVHRWRRMRSPLPALNVANAIVKARKAAIKEAQLRTIKPIVEFFPLDTTESAQGVKYELFLARTGANPLHVQLRQALSAAKGIYVFYDSRGRALYVGKAKRRTLWAEMKNAFNRNRDTQSVYRVKHPSRRQNFRPAFEKPRQPKRTQLQLNDLAAYVSAFQVDTGMIDDLEALLVRNFANDLLNVRMERYAHTRNEKHLRRPRRRSGRM